MSKENRTSNHYRLEDLPLAIGAGVEVGIGMGSQFVFRNLENKSHQDAQNASQNLASGDRAMYEAQLQRANDGIFRGAVGSFVLSPAVVMLGLLMAYKSGLFKRKLKR